MAVAAADPKAGVSEDEIASCLVEGDIAGAAGVRESSIDFVLHVITDHGGARRGGTDQVRSIGTGAQAQVAETVIKFDKLEVSVLLSDTVLRVIVGALRFKSYRVALGHLYDRTTSDEIVVVVAIPGVARGRTVGNG